MGGAILTSRGGKHISWRQKLPGRDGIYPFALMTSLFFLWGFTYGLLDVLNKHFQNTLGISKLQSTGLQVAYFGGGYFAFSPISGEMLRRKGYKFTIIVGLILYALGAIFFWPCAKFAGHSNKMAIFGGFVVCTAVTAWGLAAVEVAANSYIICFPGTEPSGAALRLQLSQSFTGVGAFAGPYIASNYFFSGKNANTLTNVQWVYLAVALAGLFVAFLFLIYNLPDISESELEEQAQAAAALAGVSSRTDQPFYKQYRALFGWLAQFMSVGSQVAIASFFINYGAEVVHWPDAKTSKFLSYALMMFAVSRFIGIAVLAIWPAELLVGICAVVCFILVTCATFLNGKAGLACLMVTIFFEGPIFPCIFVISTKDMGRHSRRAAALLISAIAGGATLPPIQGAIADRHGTHISYAVSMPAFFYIASFSFFLWIHHGAHFNLHDEPLAKVEPALEAAGVISLGLRRTRSAERPELGGKDGSDMYEEKDSR